MQTALLQRPRSVIIGDGAPRPPSSAQSESDPPFPLAAVLAPLDDDPFPADFVVREAADTAPPDAARSNLFVSGLSPAVTDAALHAFFAPFGPIESAKVMLDIHTGRSRGIAFVKFADAANAECAVRSRHNAVLCGDAIAVRVAKPHAAYRPGAPTNRTFVRNVPLALRRADLAAYFRAFGDVLDVSIHADTAQRGAAARRNIAFVTFATTAAAAAAARGTHTQTPFASCDGVPLLAKVAEDAAHRLERLSRRRGNGASPARSPMRAETPPYALAPPVVLYAGQAVGGFPPLMAPTHTPTVMYYLPNGHIAIAAPHT